MFCEMIMLNWGFELLRNNRTLADFLVMSIEIPEVLIFGDDYPHHVKLGGAVLNDF